MLLYAHNDIPLVMKALLLFLQIETQEKCCLSIH